MGRACGKPRWRGTSAGAPVRLRDAYPLGGAAKSGTNVSWRVSARARPLALRRRATRLSLPQSRLTPESLPDRSYRPPPPGARPSPPPSRTSPWTARTSPLRSRRSHRTHPEQAHDHGRTHHVALPRQSPGLSPVRSSFPCQSCLLLPPRAQPRVPPRPASAGDVDMPTRRALEVWLTPRAPSPSRPRRRTEATTALLPVPPSAPPSALYPNQTTTGVRTRSMGPLPARGGGWPRRGD